MHPTVYLFYAFSAVLVAAAVGVISVRNPVHSVMLLVLCFFSSAALWLLLEAEFLGIILILVYVGAVMVLFMFVVMMLDVGKVDSFRGSFARYLPLGILVGAITVVEIVAVVAGGSFGGERYHSPPPPMDVSNTQALGSQLYTVYVYPFELAAVILLVAIISAIALTLRRRGRRHFQDPAAQSRVRASDRLRLIKMKSE